MSDVVELKKAIACHLFLDNLQEILCKWNDEHIRCGCIRCTDMQGGNYPSYDENINHDRQENDFSRYWKSSFGPMTTPADGQCLLWDAFVTKCKQFDAPIPNTEIDHPFRYPRYFNISVCLGRASPGSFNKQNVHLRWRYRVKNLDWYSQKNTVYIMLYHLDCELNMENNPSKTFDEWFVVKGISL